MRRFFLSILFLMVLASMAVAGSARGADVKKFRAENGLVEFSAPDSFLDGYFVADEADPKYIFGPIRAFVKALGCPATWVIEESEKNRIEGLGKDAGYEYTLRLETDCPKGVAYYVFVAGSSADAKGWLEWRKKFHKSKADTEYKDAREKLEHAAASGFAITGELRFIEKDGELVTKSPEEVILNDLKLSPVYDLNGRKPVGK